MSRELHAATANRSEMSYANLKMWWELHNTNLFALEAGDCTCFSSGLKIFMDDEIFVLVQIRGSFD